MSERESFLEGWAEATKAHLEDLRTLLQQASERQAREDEARTDLSRQVIEALSRGREDGPAPMLRGLGKEGLTELVKNSLRARAEGAAAAAGQPAPAAEAPSGSDG